MNKAHPNKENKTSSCCHSESQKTSNAESAESSCGHQSQTAQSRFWADASVWKRSAYNTMWCLIGCSIGDFGTIAFFQMNDFNVSTGTVMILAVINGLLTSVLLETIIMKRNGFDWGSALKTALGMSFISMLAMEISMNLTDWWLVGGAKIVWWVIPIMLAVGFLVPWPYNYWRLKKYNKSCH